MTALSREPERLAFFAFDLPMLDGHDLRNKPLHERRRILQDILGEADLPQIAFSRDVPGTPVPRCSPRPSRWDSRASCLRT
jgi:ATP-dependent DNA ligase